MSKKPDVNDVVRGAERARDTAKAGEALADSLRSVSDLLEAHADQERKLSHCHPVMRPWHRWRRNRLADKIRARLGLGPTDPLPAPPRT